MALEQLSDFFSNFSQESIVNFDYSFINPLFYLIILIAIYSIVIWHFYRFIAKRDCFNIKTIHHQRIFSLLKYFLLFPFIAFLFFVGFALMILFITRGYDFVSILSTSFAVVIAIRLTAYYNEDLSKDVAKMLPFALLGLFIADPSYFSYSEIAVKINSLPEFLTLCFQFIILIVIAEWILRIILLIRKKIFIFMHQEYFQENTISNRS
ncbi:hypothetical protein ACFL1L_01420 [Thermoplasmatota archaeon]